jgi:uncharacterized repeat protein (TIGR02543 family)
MKKVISLTLLVIMLFGYVPSITVKAAEEATVTVENEYIRVIVNRKNGGYTISTLEGDILRKTDDNKQLTHRGTDFDTSFTSFQINGDREQEYVFGNSYGLFGMDSTEVITETDSAGVTSRWSVKDLEITQRIELVSGVSSEQLGTALISYTVKNNSARSINFKSRMLMDTQLGENDFGYYEVTKGVLGAGYNFIDKETVLSGDEVPADYFVKDSPYEPNIAAFGVNSVIATDKPYQMAFAHWANLASQKFDFDPDVTVNFTNKMNKHLTADSAVALYYDHGSVAAGGERIFSTFYGVTANLKNKDNRVLINTTAPTKLEFNETRNAFIGSSGVADNLVRINSTISNPILQNKIYRNLRAVVYTIGFTAQRQTDSGQWILYDNEVPLYTDITSFRPGSNITTFFDFKFTPQDNHELGSFVTKVFNMDPEVNELGVYAEEFCLGQTTNYIFIPAKDPALPTITLHSMEPKISYNDERRFLTVAGKGMSFFQTGLQAIELRGEAGVTYQIPLGNMTIAQDAKSISILLDEYMETGRYQLYFLWDGTQPNDIPEVFTSSEMVVHMTSDESYRNDKYGILAIHGDGDDRKYKITAYKDEFEFAQGEGRDYQADNLFFTLRGELVKDNEKEEYRVAGQNKDININYILKYNGSDFKVSENNGTVEILMDGKITTVGANTTVRNGSSVFKLNEGTKYIIPVYNSRGEIQTGDTLGYKEEYIELRWNNALDTLQTIGGFLIDLKFGVLGRMLDDGKLYNIISFGGGLDLSFMTPGGAKTARENKSKDASWEISTLNDRSGLMPLDRPVEVEKEPTTEEIYSLEAGANVHDVLYGQRKNKTGYLGINMDAHIQLPQIVSFLPSKMSGELSINTIGGYKVEIEGEGKAMTFELAFALRIMSNESGAPIPDSLFFSLGGFEPGINVDGLGIFWLTGGGGGFDNLYETIYGTDGIPPFKLLLNVQFDIFKIMTGAADLGLSLRSFSIALSDVSLKMIKNAKFLESGSVTATWYPNYDLSVGAAVNFLQIFKGRFSLVSNQEMFEMMLRVALTLPEFIPIVGGMELAAAEIGGGTEKMWGSVKVLELVKVGFTYYWASGDISFTSEGGSSSRTARVFGLMTAPQEIGTDRETGETRYIAFGSNLSHITGSVQDPSLTPESFQQLKRELHLMRAMVDDSTPAMQGGAVMQKSAMTDDSTPAIMSAASAMTGITSATAGGTPTTVISNTKQDSHVVTFGQPDGDYILTVSRMDGSPLDDDFKNIIKIWNNGDIYPLNFYQKTGLIASMGDSLLEEGKELINNAANNANVNIVGDVAYIAIPKAKQATPLFLIEFSDGGAYDIGAVYAAPISGLTSQTAVLENGILKINWTGTDLSDSAIIKVSISDVKGEDGIILKDNISAKDLSYEINIPCTVASGRYYVTFRLVDEDKCYETYDAGQIDIVDTKAPSAILGVTLTNAGNYKLLLTINDDFKKENLEGYYVDVYEDGSLIETAIYYSKEQAETGKILIGGRYDVPVLDESGNQEQDGNGNGIFRKLGFMPGKSYSVKVRAGGAEATKDGDVYHYSTFVVSESVILKEATPPKLSIISENAVPINKDGIGFALNRETNVFKLAANEPIKGSLSVNGVTGETYYFESEFKQEWQKELTLSEGVHSFEFSAVDEEGNKSLYQTSVSIDTTPPSLMLESPVNGGVFDNNEIVVKGFAEADALYTFVVDGVVIGGADRDMTEYFTDEIAGGITNGITNGIMSSTANDITGGITNNITGSMLSYTISLGNKKANRHTVEITAKDNVGNTTSKFAEVTDSSIPDISRVEVYVGGESVPSSGIKLTKTYPTAVLQLMGITDSKKLIDITDSANVSFDIVSGNSVKIDKNRITVVNEGRSIIMASLDLGGGFALTDATAVISDEEIIYDALDNAIADAKILNEDDYTAVSWSILQEAVQSGKMLRAMSGLDQEIINNAATTIVNSILSLKTKTENANAEISIAKVLVESAPYIKTQDEVSTISQAKSAVENIIGKLSLNGVITTVVDGEFTAAVAGTSTNKNGTDGSYTFVVKLNKDTGVEQITKTLKLTITASQYNASSDPNSGIDYNPSNGGAYSGNDQSTGNDTISKVRKLIENTVYADTQTNIPDIDKARNRAGTIIKDLELEGVAAKIIDGEFIAATAGTFENKDGIDGSYTFTVRLNKGTGKEQITKVLTVTIKATAYSEISGEAVQYTITYNTNGGSDISSTQITRGNPLPKPSNPVKAGYNFTGWYIDKQLTLPYDFSKEVASSFTLYAGWIKATEWQNPFVDIAKDDWFYNDVEYDIKNGLFYGTSATTFEPNIPMTRAMLVTVLHRMAGSPAVGNPAAESLSMPFTDVKNNTWYSQAIIWAAKNGIVKGIGGNRFAPDEETTREQVATILERYLEYTQINIPTTMEYRKFADENEISDYAKSATQLMNKLGIIKGKGNIDGLPVIDPKNNATRAEVAAMLHRFIEVVK